MLFLPLALLSNLYAAPTLDSGKNSLDQLFSLHILTPHKPVRLHLGCGQVYKPGYINIDFPLSKHTVQKKSVADAFCDITQLKFPNSSVEEIRSHHIFEHFFRQTALALLCAWHSWLSLGGTLCIEVPDFDANIKKLQSPLYSYAQKELIKRHIFGSHEAEWAVHCDGWGSEKFEHVLSKLGFSSISFEFNSDLLSNVTVHATKTKSLTKNELENVVYEILKDSQNGPGDVDMWQLWCDQFKAKLAVMVI